MELADAVIRLSAATLLGGVVGLERETTGKQAGLRTHALVGLGAALFTILSIGGFEGGDKARIAAQIVSGIGFLGAGAIFRSGALVKGLTTAAGLWSAAAVGMAAGAGEIALAGFATLLVAVVLALLRSFETSLNRHLRRGPALLVTVKPRHDLLDVWGRVEAIEPGIEMTSVEPKGDEVRIRLLVPRHRAGVVLGAFTTLDQVSAARIESDDASQ